MQVYEYKQIRDRFHVLCEKEFSFLYVDEDKKQVCKVFEPEFLESMLENGYDLEDLVLNGTELVESSDIVVPEGTKNSVKVNVDGKTLNLAVDYSYDVTCSGNNIISAGKVNLYNCKVAGGSTLYNYSSGSVSLAN